MVIAATGTAQAESARHQLFGDTLPELELPEPTAKAVMTEEVRLSIMASGEKALPQSGQNIIGADKFSSRVTAMQQHREVLNALRQMGMKVIESPEGGIYSYLEPGYNGMAAYTKYGYIIEYEGPQLVMDFFSPSKVSLAQWQVDNAVQALKRHGAHIMTANPNHISYIRLKGKPKILPTYDFADSRSKAERVKSNVESNLRSKGFETLFSTIYEDKYYDENWMGWKYNYQITVAYLAIVD